MCNRAIRPVSHNYLACAPEFVSLNYGRPSALEPMLRNRRSTTVRSPCSTARERAPLAAARGKPNTAMKTQHSQKGVNEQMSLKKDEAQSNIHKVAEL